MAASSSASTLPSIASPAAVKPANSSSVTAGPAAATRNSSPGVSESRSERMKPPKKNRSMPPTPIPSRRAASACPSSCSRIEPKKMNAAMTAPMNPWSGVMIAWSNESCSQ